MKIYKRRYVTSASKYNTYTYTGGVYRKQPDGTRVVDGYITKDDLDINTTSAPSQGKAKINILIKYVKSKNLNVDQFRFYELDGKPEIVEPVKVEEPEEGLKQEKVPEQLQIDFDKIN